MNWVRPNRRGSSEERGAVLITVAISLLLLIGMAALAIDGGMAYNERRSTQSAADHAALAAAWAACLNEPNPEAAGIAAAARNGYDTTDPNLDVQINETGDKEYEAIISSTRDTEFGGAIGQDDVTVVSRAVADCTERVWGGGFALFADGNSPCTNMELDFTGGGIEVNGGIHSNGDLKLNGNNGNRSDINGPVTVVGTASSNGMNFNQGPPQSSSTVEEPFQLDFSDFMPAANAGDPNYYQFVTLNDSTLAPYTNGSGQLIQSGVYYASTEIKNLTVNPAPGVRATFVSPGPISLNPGSEVHAYHPTGVAVFSNLLASSPTCDNKAIKWTGAATFTGLIYAPNGEIEFSMSSGQTAMGALVAYNLDLSGSDFTITWTDVTGGGPEYALEFRE